MARRLFARAVETPGGLKIETLHALCERLLHMFPFEANVPARFVVLDEAKAREIFDIEMANVLADAVSNGDTPLSAALARVAPEATGDTLRAAIRAAMRARNLIGDRAGLEGAFGRLHAALGLAAEETAERMEAAILEGGAGCSNRPIGRLWSRRSEPARPTTRSSPTRSRRRKPSGRARRRSPIGPRRWRSTARCSSPRRTSPRPTAASGPRACRPPPRPR